MAGVIVAERRTVSMSIPAAPPRALATVQVSQDLLTLAGVRIRIDEIAHMAQSFHVRVTFEGDWRRREALVMRWTERNWHWGAIDDLGNRYSLSGGWGGPGGHAVHFEPALHPEASVLGVRVVEAGRVLGDALIQVRDRA